MDIVLASSSPRRREILTELGFRFEVRTSSADETSDERDPAKLTELLSLRKAQAVRDMLAGEGRNLTDTLIIASDTVVASPDGEILGKPRDRADAGRMLSLLSGKTHRVVSGLSLIYGDTTVTSHDTTEVVFDELPAVFLSRYLDSDEPYDKAGAYAIQGRISMYISGMHGEYRNVVGLPVHLLTALLPRACGKEAYEVTG